MIDLSLCPILESDPAKLSGAWTFKGTRVPVSAILKNLKHLNIDQLQQEYPSISRDQIIQLLDFLARSSDPVFSGNPTPAREIHAHPAR